MKKYKWLNGTIVDVTDEPTKGGNLVRKYNSENFPTGNYNRIRDLESYREKIEKCLGTEWKPQTGKWKIKNGKLVKIES